MDQQQSEEAKLLSSGTSSKYAVVESTPIYVNVYDMAPEINRKTYKFGLGVFHSGVQILDQGIVKKEKICH